MLYEGLTVEQLRAAAEALFVFEGRSISVTQALQSAARGNHKLAKELVDYYHTQNRRT